MSATWITPAIGPVERAGQSALRLRLRPRSSRRLKRRLKLWLRRWEAVIVAELLWLIGGRREA
jgi:hypothetical protein